MTASGIGVRRPPRVSVVGVVLAGVALLLGGCGGVAPARPVPTVTLDPLDVSAFVAAPCGLLRADRAARRHLAVPGTVSAGPSGPVCRWSPTQPRVPVYTAGVAPHSGLADVFQHREDFSFVEQVDISHYPAVHTRDRAAGANLRCATRVGVADDSQLIVTADDSGVAVPSSLDTCSEADILATEIMGQLLSGTG
jgi:hypothetical protein